MQNMEEVRTIGNIVAKYYKGHEFCVITPYDAQRNAISSHLQTQKLPWETVFNVDSFQGVPIPELNH
jgi:superfamily I DNA and/or RNA helicase